MAFLSFLDGLKIEEAEVKASAPRRLSKATSPAENFMGIRIWKDGSVFPSAVLVQTLNLEYQKVSITLSPVLKDGQPVMEQKDGNSVQKMKREYVYPDNMGNGLDVIDSHEWVQYPKDQQRLLIVGVTPKTEPKVDLFAVTRYNDDGTPTASVLTQGSDTAGKALLLSIKEVYNTEPNEEGFIDLLVVTEQDMSSLSSNKIFILPKKVVRGENAGKAAYERRENIFLYPLVPEALLRPVSSSPTVEGITQA